MFSKKCLLGLVLLFSCASFSSAANFYQFNIAIGGYDWNCLFNTTPDNQKIVGPNYSESSASVWEFNGSGYEQTTLPGSYSFTSAITPDGSMIVGGYNGAVVWKQTGATYDDVTVLHATGAAMDISSNGNTVVGYTEDGFDNAAVWINSGEGYGEAILLETSQWTDSYGLNVSDDGSVVMGAIDGEGVIWRNEGSGFGMPVSLGGKPRNMTSDGSMIVGYVEDGYPSYAAVWTDSGSGFGTPTLLDSGQLATCVSEDKKIIGGIHEGVNGATIWKYNESLDSWDYYNLAELLSSQGIDLTDWTLYAVQDINYDSATGTYSFVGIGLYQGGFSGAFLADGVYVPEPATVVLLMLGGMSLLRKRK